MEIWWVIVHMTLKLSLRDQSYGQRAEIDKPLKFILKSAAFLQGLTKWNRLPPLLGMRYIVQDWLESMSSRTQIHKG